jgi:hypothetical protein
MGGAFAKPIIHPGAKKNELFPGRGAARSGAPLIRERPKL